MYLVRPNALSPVECWRRIEAYLSPYPSVCIPSSLPPFLSLYLSRLPLCSYWLQLKSTGAERSGAEDRGHHRERGVRNDKPIWRRGGCSVDQSAARRVERCVAGRREAEGGWRVWGEGRVMIPAWGMQREKEGEMKWGVWWKTWKWIWLLNLWT